MPYTLKTQQIAVKDPDTGVYSGVDILTEQTTEGLLTEIIATGNEVKTDVAAQMATERSDFNTYISGKEAELDQYKSTTETNINNYVTTKNQEIATMIAEADEDVSDLEDRKQDVADAVADMLGQGVDNTLTTANVPAESKAVGDLFETVVQGKSTQPSDKWNRLWIKPSASDYEIPTMDEFDDLKSALYNDFKYISGQYNLLEDATFINGYYIGDDGQIQKSSGFAYTSLIPIENIGYVLYWSNLSGANHLRIHGYDSNENWVAQLFQGNLGNAAHFSGFGYSYVRISFNTSTHKIWCFAKEHTIVEMAEGLYKSNARDFLFDTATKESKTSSGITYSWDGEKWSVSGSTPSGTPSVNVLLSSRATPEDVSAGNILYVKYKTSDAKVKLRIIFRNASDENVETQFITDDTNIVIPESTSKWTVGIYVPRNTAITGTAIVSDIRILSTESNDDLVKYSFMSRSILKNNTDFDNVKSEGHWLISNEYTYTHNPINGLGTLEVMVNTDNSIIQRAIQQDTGEIYVRTSRIGVFSNNWVKIAEGETVLLYGDLVNNQLIHLNKTNLFYNSNDREYTDNAFRSKLIPVRKDDSVYLRTTGGTGNAKPYAKVTYNYLIDTIYTDSADFEGIITFEYDGFLAVNLMKTEQNNFMCVITPKNKRRSQLVNALQNETYQTGEYDDYNVCRVLKTGPSMMGAIHHWGIIGASYDSGELNYTIENTTGYSMVDWYEYSWGQYLKRINGIPDLYNYSNGGQNARDWIKMTSTDRMGHYFSTSTEEIVTTFSSGAKYSGIGPGGGCWWKLKADHENGDTKQAFILVLGSNDINNNYPHDADWQPLEEYDENIYYKAGTVEDIGTYDLATDTDTVPVGKTSGTAINGIVNSYAAYIGAVLNRILAIQPDAIIFVATIRNNFSDVKNKQDVWKEYNNVLKAVVGMDAYKNNCYLLDFATFGPNYSTKRFAETKLGQHPVAMAYQLVAQYYNTLLDYVIMSNLKKMRESAFIGTGKVFTPQA